MSGEVEIPASVEGETVREVRSGAARRPADAGRSFAARYTYSVTVNILPTRDVLDGLAAAASEGDLDAIDALASNERLSESFRRLMTAFPDVRVILDWTVMEGPRAVGWAHITGTHRGVWRGLEPTNRTIDVHGMLALELTGSGGVHDFWLVNDWLGIATQLGARLDLPPTVALPNPAASPSA